MGLLRIGSVLALIARLAVFASAEPSATATSSATAASASATGAIHDLQVDVLFPHSNGTYNLTDSLPVVLAVRNLHYLQSFGSNVTLSWDIMPYGDVGEPLEPGGVSEDGWEHVFTPHEKMDKDTFFVVNATNVQKWANGPRFPRGSTYALQWYIEWPESDGDCPKPHGESFFNINLGAAEPKESDIFKCPDFVGSFGVQAVSGKSCPAVTANMRSGAKCGGVTVSKAEQSSILSALHKAEATATATTTAASVAVPTETEGKKSAAYKFGAPLQVVAGAVLLLSL